MSIVYAMTDYMLYRLSLKYFSGIITLIYCIVCEIVIIMLHSDDIAKKCLKVLWVDVETIFKHFLSLIVCHYYIYAPTTAFLKLFFILSTSFLLVNEGEQCTR